MMASDGCSNEQLDFKGFSLALNVSDQAAAEKAFAGLSDSGTVCIPLEKTFWSPCFGMVQDRFGISWMISVQA